MLAMGVGHGWILLLVVAGAAVLVAIPIAIGFALGWYARGRKETAPPRS